MKPEFINKPSCDILAALTFWHRLFPLRSRSEHAGNLRGHLRGDVPRYGVGEDVLIAARGIEPGLGFLFTFAAAAAADGLHRRP